MTEYAFPLAAPQQRLSALLLTSDVHVLCSAIAVLLRPAAQYSIHTPFELSRTASGGRHVELHRRLLGLASGWGTWGALRERDLDMGALAERERAPTGDAHEADIQISFYRAGAGASEDVVHASELEQPTADLQLNSLGQSHSEGQVAQAAVDSPSRPAPAGARSTPLKYSFGLGLGSDSTPGALATPNANAQVTPLARPAPKRLQSTIGIDPESGVQSASNADGFTTLTVPASFLAAANARGAGPNQVLAELVQRCQVPKSAWYHLLGKLRAGMILAAEPDTEKRRDMIVCRLLALATYRESALCTWDCCSGSLSAHGSPVYLTPEDMAQTELFLYEPTLVSQLADLAHPSAHEKIGDRVLASAFTALEACARYRSKSTEVLTAVNANVGHGILMSSFRSLVTRLAGNGGRSSVDCEMNETKLVASLDVTHELVDSMIAFLAHAATIPGYGNMLLGAGLVPLLIDLVKIENPARASVSLL